MSRLFCVCLFAIAAPVYAQENAKPARQEWTPPGPASETIFSYYIPNAPPMWGTREVWQYYGVDGTGRFRPLVINSPLGAYYRYNGRPYPWTTTHPMFYMPYVVD